MDAADLRVTLQEGTAETTTGSITISARIAERDSTSPCTSSENIGSFTVPYDETGVSPSTSSTR